MHSLSVQVMSWKISSFLFFPLFSSCSPPPGATKNRRFSKLSSHMIFLALLNLVEFMLFL